MASLNNLKSILQLAGISRMKIQFDNERRLVNIDYVFKGKPGKKEYTFQEITELLSLGLSGPSANAGAARAGELTELTGEK